ncbi:MAG: Bax inhibitor-1/YccA family protein [Candidatus Egerieousia sp.]
MNPVLNDNVMKNTAGVGPIVITDDTMTVKGAVRKTVILLVMLLAGAAYTWKVYYDSINPSSVSIWMTCGIIGAFILAMIISFKPKTAPYLSPVYAVGEGFALGGISAMLNDAFATKDAYGVVVANSNIVTNAVLITIVTTFVALFVYRSRIIKVNSTFTKVISIALISILAFYLIGMLVSLFGGANSSFMQALYGNSLLSIGINAVIAVIAALSLLQDFHFIETGAAAGAPKYMEWYGAFGLMVTLVWLYLEVLRLLSKIQSRN